MKAKEWAAKFHAATNGEDAESCSNGVKNLVDAYCEETRVLIVARGGTDGAIEGAIKEQLKKWKSISEQAGIDEDLIYYALEAFMPSHMRLYNKITAKQYQKKLYNNLRNEMRARRREIDAIEDPTLRLGHLIAYVLEGFDRRREIDEETKLLTR